MEEDINHIPFIDAKNAIQVWLHTIISYQNIYPSQAFAIRNIYGVTLPVSNSPKLSSYLDTFTNEVYKHINNLNGIEMWFYKDGLVVEKYYLSIKKLNSEAISNNIQKQLELKKYYYSLASLKNNQYKPTDNFKLFMQYKINYDREDSSLVYQWVKVDNNDGLQNGSVIGAISIQQLQIIHGKIP